jgi:hypothetical protein
MFLFPIPYLWQTELPPPPPPPERRDIIYIAKKHNGGDFPGNRCAPAPYQGGQRCTSAILLVIV